jgi:hypothetical protein
MKRTLALLLLFALTTITSTAAGDVSPITDDAVWKDGRPDSFVGNVHPAVESAVLFAPGEHDWKYSHHQSVTAFGNELFAIWSSSERDEDSAGQRVMYAYRNEKGWIVPRILFQPDIDPDGRLRVLTAAGFHQHDGLLVAYAGDYSLDRKSTRLLARTSKDGRIWSPVVDLHVPVCPNHGPQRTASGRLIIAGNTAFPYTDDPSGLTGWKVSGIYPAAMEPFQDNPSTFWDVAGRTHFANLCEGSFYQTDDGTLHMMLRSTGKAWPPPSFHLWESQSTDNGTTWGAPRETSFSNTDAKFHFGRLPDGRFYCVGNPLGVGRIPLVLSLSRDGIRFDQHFILGDQHYRRRFDGAAKGGEYSYPHSVVFDGRLYVIAARQKETIEVFSVALGDLERKSQPEQCQESRP